MPLSTTETARVFQHARLATTAARQVHENMSKFGDVIAQATGRYGAGEWLEKAMGGGRYGASEWLEHGLGYGSLSHAAFMGETMSFSSAAASAPTANIRPVR